MAALSENLELHGDDRWNTLLEEALRGAGKGIDTAGAGSLTSIQDNQAQRAMIGEQHPEILAADHPSPPVFVLKDQSAILGRVIKARMADEMEDVVLSILQSALQSQQRSDLQPIHRYQPRLLHVGECAGKLGPFPLDIQGRVVGWTRDHDECARKAA